MWVDFVLLFLAAVRITVFLTRDQLGHRLIVSRVRRWAGLPVGVPGWPDGVTGEMWAAMSPKVFLALAFSCPVCAGVWASAVVVAWYWAGGSMWPVGALALSLLVGEVSARLG